MKSREALKWDAEQKDSLPDLLQSALLRSFRTKCFGNFAQPEPIAFDCLADLNEVIEVHRFDEERIRSELIRAIHVRDFFRRSEDDHAQGLQARILANPS